MRRNMMIVMALVLFLIGTFLSGNGWAQWSSPGKITNLRCGEAATRIDMNITLPNGKSFARVDRTSSDHNRILALAVSAMSQNLDVSLDMDGNFAVNIEVIAP